MAALAKHSRVCGGHLVVTTLSAVLDLEVVEALNLLGRLLRQVAKLGEAAGHIL